MELLKDRNTYRQCDDSLLIEAGRYRPTPELALVLAERLEETLALLDDKDETLASSKEAYEIEINQYDDKVYLLQAEIEKLESKLKEHEA